MTAAAVEALREALTECVEALRCLRENNAIGGGTAEDVRRIEQNARAALSQLPQGPVASPPEPVAWRWRGWQGYWVYGDKSPLVPDGAEQFVEPLYLAPVASPPMEAQ